MTAGNKIHNPETIFGPIGNFYAQAVEVPANSRHLFVSGQVGIKPDGTVPESIEEQVEETIRNLVAILDSAGMAYSDIVKINAYLTSVDDVPTYAMIRTRIFAGLQAASTSVVVASLAKPEWKIEVEVVAAATR